MKYKIEELCEINSENISKSDDIKYIYYLDTSNLTRGTINEIQKLIVGKDKLPGRAKRKVKVNDILISTVRPNQRHYGIIRKEIENLIVSTGFAVLSPNLKKVNPEYLYWYLTQDSIVNYLQSIAETSTSAYPSIKPSVIGGLEIDLPKLEEQKAIANILSTLDEKIETNNQINEKLEEMAQALFKHWFVDFEFPNENGKPYKSSGGEMVESELGMIPKGWEVGTIKDIGEVVGGGTPSKKKNDYYTSNGIPWITPKDLSGFNKRYIKKGSIDITHKGYKNSSAKMLPKGSVLFSSRAPIGYIAIASNEVTTNQGFKSVIPFENFGTEFVFQTLKSNLETIKNRASGSTFKEISGGELKKIEVILPPQNVVDKFNQRTKQIGELIAIYEEQNERLEKLRDTLLPKLMSGEIRIPMEDGVLSEKN